MSCLLHQFRPGNLQIQLLALSILFCSYKLELHAQDYKLVLLGIAQDAGAPHIGCVKSCCTTFRNKGVSHQVVSLALIDNKTNKYWIFEASPDISGQLNAVNQDHLTNQEFSNPEGIFLTHAHIGHYSGLMYFGREGMNANRLPVYAMPKMESYLRNNGPWSQLVNLNNIQLVSIQAEKAVSLNPEVNIVPFYVPHRDEFSETVGYKLQIAGKKILFIPDVDNWTRINPEVIGEMESADYLILDATFYSKNELPNRNIDEIPHPLVTETIRMVESWENFDPKQLVLIHFNHSNPLLIEGSLEYQSVKEKGITIGKTGMVLDL